MENPTKRERLQQLFVPISDEVLWYIAMKSAEASEKPYTGSKPKGLVTDWSDRDSGEVVLCDKYHVCSQTLLKDYVTLEIYFNEYEEDLVVVTYYMEIPLEGDWEDLYFEKAENRNCHDLPKVVFNDKMFEDEECKVAILQIIKDTFPEKLPEAEALFA